jgi:hypothetical protein
VRTIASAILTCLLLLICDEPSSGSDLHLKPAAPDGIGFTLRQSPVLYYFVSEATRLPTRFTLMNAETQDVVAELPLSSPTTAGYWPIRFKDHGIVLVPGVGYRWFVRVIRNTAAPSDDLVAGGRIECCPEELIYLDVPKRCSTEAVREYASNGIWYDAFACVSELIEEEPNNQRLRRLRDRLTTEMHLHRVE